MNEPAKDYLEGYTPTAELKAEVVRLLDQLDTLAPLDNYYLRVIKAFIGRIIEKAAA